MSGAPAKSYQVIVLGDSLAALVAATTAANDGADTLWIPQERRTWSVHSGGYNFPVEEGLVTGMAPGGAFTLLCEGTGLHPSEALKFKAVEPSVQVLTPQFRLSLYSQSEQLHHELRLECGAEDGPRAEAYLEKADKLRKQVDTWIAHLVRSTDESIPPPPAQDVGEAPGMLGEALDALLAGVTHAVDQRVLHSFERARAMGVFRAGVFDTNFAGSEDDAQADRRKRLASSPALAIRHLLAARAKHTPLTILRERSVKAIRTRWGAVRGVRLDDKSTIDAEFIISALDDADNVDVEGFIGKRRAGVHPNGIARTYTVHIVAGRKVFPVGLGARAILVGDPKAPLLGANHVIMSREVIDEDAERVALTTRVPLTADKNERAAILKRVIGRFRDVVPFVDDDLRGVFPPIGTSVDLKPDRKQTDPWSIVRGPLAVAQRPTGSFPGGRFESPLANLFRTGPATLPGLGYEGELVSGVAVGRRTLRLARKR